MKESPRATVRAVSSRELYLRLLRYVAPYRHVFLVAILGAILVALTEAALPAIMKPLFDGVFVERDAAMIRWMPLVIIALFVVRGLAEYAATYCMAWVGNRLVMDLRTQMFARLLELPTPYYDEQASGNLISKLTFDVTQVTSAATSVLVAIFKDGVAIVGLLAWMFWLNWKLTLLSLLMTPLIILIVRLVSIRLRNTSRDVQNSMGEVTQVIQEAIEGHKIVKLYGGQAYEAGRFEHETNRVRRFLMKQAAAAATSVPFVQLVAASALAAMIFFRHARCVDHRRWFCFFSHGDVDADRAVKARHQCERAAATRPGGGGKRVCVARSARRKRQRQRYHRSRHRRISV